MSDLPLQTLSVDLDERAYLFPETRCLAQLKFSAKEHRYIQIDLLFSHNESRLPPSSLTLLYTDAKELCLRLVDAVYFAKTSNAITDTMHISITVAANGYILAVEDEAVEKRLYLSTGVIWRVCNALCKIVDIQSPVGSN
ncbi:MAG: hypothetical protein EPN21_03540 [Methylococcaceae bacterium]|nr:MAG: hypothetical protein EPN21_03540 [Methylococcaceae bacterium]